MQPTFEDLYLAQLDRTVRVLRAEGELAAKLYGALALTAEGLLAAIKSRPELQDPFLVALMIDGIRYRQERIK